MFFLIFNHTVNAKPHQKDEEKADASVIAFLDVHFGPYQLRLHTPNINCTPDLSQKLCWPDNEKIILDPGHSDLGTDGLGRYLFNRKGKKAANQFDIQSTEGKQNMSIAVIAYAYLKECSKVPLERLSLTRWPGEKNYGEYLSKIQQPTNTPFPQSGEILNKANDGLMAHILALHNRLDFPTLGTGKSVLVSIHQNALKTDKKIYDSINIFVNGNPKKEIDQQSVDPRSLEIAKNILGFVKEQSLPFYTGQSLQNIESKSRVRAQDYLVLKGRDPSPLPDTLSRMLVETYFMNQSLGNLVNKSLYRNTINPLESIYAEAREPTANVKSGFHKVSETYDLFPLQKAAAYGIAKGLVETFRCKE